MRTRPSTHAHSTTSPHSVQSHGSRSSTSANEHESQFSPPELKYSSSKRRASVSSRVSFEDAADAVQNRVYVGLNDGLVVGLAVVGLSVGFGVVGLVDGEIVVGLLVGVVVGLALVGDVVGFDVGLRVGLGDDGLAVGELDGESVVGLDVGRLEGEIEGETDVGETVGVFVGEFVFSQKRKPVPLMMHSISLEAHRGGSSTHFPSFSVVFNAFLLFPPVLLKSRTFKFGNESSSVVKNG